MEEEAGPTAVLKNALDSAYYAWNRKPLAFIGYGGMGGVRAIEQLLTGKTPADFPYLNDALAALVDNLAWWGEALKAQRETTAP